MDADGLVRLTTDQNVVAAAIFLMVFLGFFVATRL